jgi:tRNA dimethylallyltransferase
MNKMPKIIICGQTATGKTSLALKLAKENNGEILSADSRQIYSNMDIGTGKIDSSDNLIRAGQQWILNDIPIYGLNLVTPDKLYSSGDFAEYGEKVIRQIQEKEKKPIIVGGTGFYIKSLLLPDETISIPLNQELRNKYEELEKNTLPDELKLRMMDDLQKIDPEKYTRMNTSDKTNPRRLVRAIEVAEWNNNQKETRTNRTLPDNSADDVWIGLTAPKEYLLERITKRVNQMVNEGLEGEVRKLLEVYSWDSAGMKTLGYKEWKEYFDKTSTKEEVVEKIITAHLQYARKQMIYFRRFPFIKWFDISNPGWEENLQHSAKLL